jgi:hypothetical protein
MSKFQKFDRSRLNIKNLSERIHDLTKDIILPIKNVPIIHQAFNKVAEAIHVAEKNNSSRILMIGAHVLRKGCQLYLNDLMHRGAISCLAINGAVAIHDFEFSLIGATTESVAKYIKNGQFGLWKETSLINDIIVKGVKQGLGAGEAIGRAIYESNDMHKEISVLSTAWSCGIPVTVHVGIGYDIIAEHPNFDGGAWGEASYIDFLIFTKIISELEGGVVMNFGSSVMAPEIYLKALSMARNVTSQEGNKITNFTTLVCDLCKLPDNIKDEPPKNTFEYYFRPLKTMLIRTIADGGTALYVCGDHSITIPQLWTSYISTSSNS